eukprot:TRINITY_DN665_c0_g2_i2.p1 TRINITY_DN665_c0_g2~~TRINITY_DN665_c0_g2_i2.p1  ORF type:complete len:258 (-),score=27.19 TRINITY_DN665_c0_g2_i2:174-947(-)
MCIRDRYLRRENTPMFLSRLFKDAKFFQNTNSLVHKEMMGIVYRYQQQRSPFDKTNYVEGWVPRPNKYHKARKPRLPQWDDPNVHWPPVLAQPTKLKGRSLIREVEAQEKAQIEKLRPFKVPDFRSGDVIEFDYMFSLSEAKGNNLVGIVIGRKQRDTLNSSFKVVVRFCGVEMLMNVKQFSPLVTSLKILTRGSGNLRSKLNYIWQKTLTRDQSRKAVVKRAMKKRKDDYIIKKEDNLLISRKVSLDKVVVDPLLD